MVHMHLKLKLEYQIKVKLWTALATFFIFFPDFLVIKFVSLNFQFFPFLFSFQRSIILFSLGHSSQQFSCFQCQLIDAHKERQKIQLKKIIKLETGGW